MHLVFWMTWWIDTYRSKDTLTRWIVGARGFSGKTRVTARSNVSHFLSVGIQASGNMDDPKLNFKKLNRQPNSLAWGQGGQVNPGQTVTFDFVVDIPDLSKEIPKDAQLEKGYLFTLREVPTLDGKITPMPEPSSLILLGTSASCLIGFVWLRHCRTR